MAKILFGGDWHFRHSNPKCRTDNFAEAIIKKLKWLKDLQKEYNCPVVSGGDLLDSALYKSPTDIVLTLNMLEEHLIPLIGIIGNHSLLHRSYEYLEKSTISVLIKSGKLTHIHGYYDIDDHTRLHGFDYGTGGIKHSEDLIDGVNVAILHEYTSKEPNSLFGKYVGIDLLKEFQEYDVILSSDNHQTFTQEYDGRFLINPGSFVRDSADQINHKPCVFFIDFSKMSFEPIYVPIEEGVISREHIDIQNQRKENIEYFVENLEKEYELTESFKNNMENYIATNRYNTEDKEILQINSNTEKFINMAMEGNLAGYE